MLLKIDIRETKVYDRIIARDLMTTNNFITYSKESLDLGDFVICLNNNKSDNKTETDTVEEQVIIERKTLNDLLCSVKDGRYAEQSYRLNNYKTVHNHNIVYIIEGNVNQTRYSPQQKKIINSSIASICLFKGFSVIRTYSIDETIDLLFSISNQIHKKIVGNKRQLYYSNGYHNNEGEISLLIDNNNDKQNLNGESAGHIADYVDVVKIKKKNNLTSDNIGIIILSQIPGLSVISSRAIMQNYDSIYELITALNTNKQCLDSICYETSNGKMRKVSKTAIKNIINYLFNIKPDISVSMI